MVVSITKNMLRRFFSIRVGYTNQLTNFIYFNPNEVPNEGDYDIVKVDISNAALKNKISKTTLCFTKKIGSCTIKAFEKTIVVFDTTDIYYPTVKRFNSDVYWKNKNKLTNI